MTTTTTEQLECLQHNADCDGPVEYRLSLSGTGRSFPRCEHHFDLRLAEQDRIQATYGSPSAPSWFDEGYAGERWEEDA